MIVATAAVGDDEAARREALVIDFLNTDVVLRWDKGFDWGAASVRAMTQQIKVVNDSVHASKRGYGLAATTLIKMRGGQDALSLGASFEQIDVEGEADARKYMMLSATYAVVPKLRLALSYGLLDDVVGLVGLGDERVGDEARDVDVVPLGDPPQELVAGPEPDLGETAGDEVQEKEQTEARGEQAHDLVAVDRDEGPERRAGQAQEQRQHGPHVGERERVDRRGHVCATDSHGRGEDRGAGDKVLSHASSPVPAPAAPCPSRCTRASG